jgi:putative transposase
MKLQRALKVRLYLTLEQANFLNKTLGCCRFLYNQMLAERIQTYEALKDDKEALHTHHYKTEKEYKAEFDFLKEADALQQARRNLESAYANFFNSFKGARKGEAGFPKFKAKKKRKDSYRTGMSITVDLDNQTIKLPKVKEPVVFRHKKNIKAWFATAELKNITITKTATGKYYASCLYEGEQDYTGYQEKRDKIIGLDMSLRNFYVDNLGNSPNYVRVYRKGETRLAKYQRRLARKPSGSRNREKSK